MEHLTFSAELMHKHRAIELQEIARVERFLQEKKNRDAMDWQRRTSATEPQESLARI